jgi:uncharacterized protein (TIGR00290 family)
MSMENVIVSWSSGKDSALALYTLMDDPEIKIAGLLTTILSDSNKVSMHHVDRGLVEQQAESLDLPLEMVYFDPDEPLDNYECDMRDTLMRFQEQGISAVVSGDINLETLRANREQKLGQIGMRAIFPLWERNTQGLTEFLINNQFKTVITSVDTEMLNVDYLGKVIDNHLLSTLPFGIDPCGENGEYHSFVFDGPIFREPVQYTLGEVETHDGRYYFRDIFLRCK